MKQFQSVSKLAVLLLALAVPTVAGKPIITINPAAPTVIAAADGCGFDVYVVPQPGRPNGGKIIAFTNSQVLSGPLFVTVTNGATNKAINLNISGPGKFSFTSNTSTFVFEGPALLWGLPPSLALPPVSFTHGRIALVFDDQGNLTSASSTGTVEDVCQLLQ
ncbi:MAG TPA: hypothetical protein VKB49_05740 [Candidatus Sulfotelmatobacter sp.]|nr:hypothetical protein [Candidatus Sulfotelmatobacter sp.]